MEWRLYRDFPDNRHPVTLLALVHIRISNSATESRLRQDIHGPSDGQRPSGLAISSSCEGLSTSGEVIWGRGAETLRRHALHRLRPGDRLQLLRRRPQGPALLGVPGADTEGAVGEGKGAHR